MACRVGGVQHGEVSDRPPLITDAAPSLAEEQAGRRRTYVVIMLVHLVGFAVSYPLYLWQPWAGAAMVLCTGLLPWVAVVIANAPRRTQRRERSAVSRTVPLALRGSSSTGSTRSGTL
jgi:hypothetical protein